MGVNHGITWKHADWGGRSLAWRCQWPRYRCARVTLHYRLHVAGEQSCLLAVSASFRPSAVLPNL